MVMYHEAPEEMYGIKNYWMLVNKQIRMEGFINYWMLVGSQITMEVAIEKHEAMIDKIAPLIASGTFKVLQDVTEGIDNAPEGLAGVFNGKNFGKAILKVAEPDA